MTSCALLIRTGELGMATYLTAFEGINIGATIGRRRNSCISHGKMLAWMMVAESWVVEVQRGVLGWLLWGEADRAPGQMMVIRL